MYRTAPAPQHSGYPWLVPLKKPQGTPSTNAGIEGFLIIGALINILNSTDSLMIRPTTTSVGIKVSWKIDTLQDHHRKETKNRGKNIL